jgi:hypothetical protein
MSEFVLRLIRENGSLVEQNSRPLSLAWVQEDTLKTPTIIVEYPTFALTANDILFMVEMTLAPRTRRAKESGYLTDFETRLSEWFNDRPIEST